VRDDGETPGDGELVERARRGDASALDVLIPRHQEVAYRVALGIVGDADEAADVVQDAFVKVIRGLDGFRGDARFRTWLLSIVVNEARGELRRRGRRRETPLDDARPFAGGNPDPAEAAVLESEAGRARWALARLPDKQRLSVQLRVDEGLSFREVGEVIGSTEGAARVNYHHGVRKLRQMLEGEP
jgi:RNA polymerase sigma-70 factor (ECF subfamily)